MKSEIKVIKIKLFLTIFCAFLMIIAILFPACKSEKSNPKLDPILEGLIEANNKGKAEQYAQSYSLNLNEKGVFVVIEPDAGKFEQALKVTDSFGDVGGSSIKLNEIDAFVPINNLIPLSNESSIKFIGLPSTVVH